MHKIYAYRAFDKSLSNTFCFITENTPYFFTSYIRTPFKFVQIKEYISHNLEYILYLYLSDSTNLINISKV